MIVDQLVLGAYENNCYVIRKEKDSKKCLIIDTGLDVDPLIEYLENNKLDPVAVICTHGHADHIAGISQVHEIYPSMKIVIHKNDADMLTSADLNLSTMADVEIQAKPADIIIDHPHEICLADMCFDVLETPGHTPGGICLYFKDEKVLFAGDTLFAGSVGRTDFPGYDQQRAHRQLIESINEKLINLPLETRVYPGHGDVTSIEYEKRNNPYLNEF